jgi:hypothetical protein
MIDKIDKQRRIEAPQKARSFHIGAEACGEHEIKGCQQDQGEKKFEKKHYPDQKLV